jgi:hypothetical protein
LSHQHLYFRNGVRGLVAFTFPVGAVEWRRILDPDEALYSPR